MMKRSASFWARFLRDVLDAVAHGSEFLETIARATSVRVSYRRPSGLAAEDWTGGSLTRVAPCDC
jgi:hypothetical protein